MDCKKTRILYIAGNGRSGSTVIDQILGQIPGWFTVGELADFWQRGPLQLCGCGRVLKDCDFWRQVFVEAFQDTPDRFDFVAVSALRNRCARSRHLFLITNSLTRRLVQPALNEYADLTKRLYQAVSTMAGATVIVDSSKLASHAYLLELTGAVELFMVHLVRDPRGVAYSWMKSRRHPNPAIGDFEHWHPARTALNWVYTNGAIRKLWGAAEGRYLALRYEDFIAQPEASVRQIMQFVGQPATSLPFLSDHSVSLAPTHGVSGNTVRFESGPVHLTLDDKWCTAMTPMHKLLVTTLTGVALPTFGYSFEPIWRANRGH
jgi:Sulfotransferase family